MRLSAVVLVLFLSTISCSRKTPPSEFGKIVEEFVYKTLSFSPVTASGQGLHKYNGADFDRLLDDFSSRSIQAQRNYYVDLHKRENILVDANPIKLQEIGPGRGKLPLQF